MTGIVRASFVVRVTHDERGQINGVVELVATGAKEAFSDLEAIGGLIGRMLGRDGGAPPAGRGTPASGP